MRSLIITAALALLDFTRVVEIVATKDGNPTKIESIKYEKGISENHGRWYVDQDHLPKRIDVIVDGKKYKRRLMKGNHVISIEI